MNGNGLDFEIDKIKVHLEKYLKYDKIDFYGRVYKNPSKNNEGKILPEIYTGSKGYREVLTNDLSNGVVFFTDSGTHKSVNSLEFETTISIIFIVNLSKLKGDLVRKDSEVQTEVLSIINNLKQLEKIELVTGLEALHEFDISKIKLSDMQPWHIFSIKGQIKYNINHC